MKMNFLNRISNRVHYYKLSRMLQDILNIILLSFIYSMKYLNKILNFVWENPLSTQYKLILKKTTTKVMFCTVYWSPVCMYNASVAWGLTEAVKMEVSTIGKNITVRTSSKWKKLKSHGYTEGSIIQGIERRQPMNIRIYLIRVI